MATLTARPATAPVPERSALAAGEWVHRGMLTLAACAIAGLLVFLAVHGYSYYSLRLEDRPLSPLHAQLRSSGTIGLKLGLTALTMFGLLSLYPLRKRWPWLSRIGSTRRWLNFHILLGMSTPLVVTFHSTFRTHGVAGLAYWTMVAVALSGFAGRYIYAKIPRSRTSAELSLEELRAEAASLATLIREQSLFREEEIAPLLSVPSAHALRRMSPLASLWIMLRMDLARPLLLSRLRRRALGRSQRIMTLWGLLASHDAKIEFAVSIIRRQSRLCFSVAFLDRTERIFHLWHVIHRPFSISFAVLIAVHIGVALSMGAWSWTR